MSPTDKYAYRVVWSDDDGSYVGLCAEFPSLSWMADTQGRALSGIRRLVSESVRDMADNRESPPAPFATRRYSGAFKIRIPSDVHRALVTRAAEQNVSMNRFVAAVIGVGLGSLSGAAATARAGRAATRIAKRGVLRSSGLAK